MGLPPLPPQGSASASFATRASSLSRTNFFVFLRALLGFHFSSYLPSGFIPKVIEFRFSCVGFLGDFNFCDGRQAKREGLFNANTAGNFSDGYRTARLISVFSRNNGALKRLNSGFVALFYFLVDLNIPAGF